MCSICGQTPCNCRCPNFKLIPTECPCCICGDDIQPNEKYLKNKDSDYVHYNCIDDIEWLINWATLDVKGGE